MAAFGLSPVTCMGFPSQPDSQSVFSVLASQPTGVRSGVLAALSAQLGEAQPSRQRPSSWPSKGQLQPSWCKSSSSWARPDSPPARSATCTVIRNVLADLRAIWDGKRVGEPSVPVRVAGEPSSAPVVSLAVGVQTQTDAGEDKIQANGATSVGRCGPTAASQRAEAEPNGGVLSLDAGTNTAAPRVEEASTSPRSPFPARSRVTMVSAPTSPLVLSPSLEKVAVLPDPSSAGSPSAFLPSQPMSTNPRPQVHSGAPKLSADELYMGLKREIEALEALHDAVSQAADVGAAVRVRRAEECEIDSLATLLTQHQRRQNLEQAMLTKELEHQLALCKQQQQQQRQQQQQQQLQLQQQQLRAPPVPCPC
eukprot:RCo002731